MAAPAEKIDCESTVVRTASSELSRRPTRVRLALPAIDVDPTAGESERDDFDVDLILVIAVVDVDHPRQPVGVDRQQLGTWAVDRERVGDDEFALDKQDRLAIERRCKEDVVRVDCCIGRIDRLAQGSEPVGSIDDVLLGVNDERVGHFKGAHIDPGGRVAIAVRHTGYCLQSLYHY